MTRDREKDKHGDDNEFVHCGDVVGCSESRCSGSGVPSRVLWVMCSGSGCSGAGNRPLQWLRACDFLSLWDMSQLLLSERHRARCPMYFPLILRFSLELFTP